MNDCNAQTERKQDENEESSNSESEEEENKSKYGDDIFTSQMEKLNKGTSDDLDSILNDISSLQSLGQWNLGKAE